MRRRDAERRIAALAAKQSGLFTYAQALGAGFSPEAIRYRLSCDRFVKLGKGVLSLRGVPASWDRRLWTAVLNSGEGAIASHMTAAFVWGLVEREPPVIDVSVAKTRRPRPISGTRIHRVTSLESVRRRRLPITTVPRTILDLADSDISERVLDAALDKRFTTVVRMKACIAPLRTNAGLGRLDRILDDRIRGTSATELERIFDQVIKRARLPLPARQHPIGRRRVDIAYVDERIVIELDGGGSHMRKEVFEDDRRRQNDLVLAGWLVLRFTWDDVTKQSDRVVETVRHALEMRSRNAAGEIFPSASP